MSNKIKPTVPGLNTDLAGRKSDQCRALCSAGNPCTLSREVKHTLHVCLNVDCHCHSFTRYQDERAAFYLGGP